MEAVSNYRQLLAATAALAATWSEEIYQFKREAEACATDKRRRAIESAQIAAQLEPKPLPLCLLVPRASRPIRQPPGRFAFYQGDF